MSQLASEQPGLIFALASVLSFKTINRAAVVEIISDRSRGGQLTGREKPGMTQDVVYPLSLVTIGTELEASE